MTIVTAQMSVSADGYKAASIRLRRNSAVPNAAEMTSTMITARFT
jgi:hypothetical protein